MKTRFFLVSLFVFVLFLGVSSVSADTTCTFTADGTTLRLDGNCTTDSTIFVPDGFTLDGNGYTITGVDPIGGHFVGAVVANGGTVAHVHNLGVTVSGLANVCDAGADRLRGIMFEGASGSIVGNTVFGINQGPSGCQEGNAIEIRNEPFDGSHPNTQYVEIAHNTLVDWQKTGIVANGDVSVNIHHNWIGASATQANLAANSVQIGSGGTGSIMHNYIEGNQWLGTSDYAATAILIYLADGVTIRQNNLRGNADIGIYFYGDNGVVDNNRVFDEGADAPTSGYDYGIGNWGNDNVVTNNKVRGFEIPYDGVEGGKNKVIPAPHS
ncbi:MAG: right-handed parallel beta-helix repeat-containing protein [Anaerolineaceae bacterium]|nr:right-handed parallel beta-helix repeat-containing protein [Anaerolineaceae bacterium]